MTTYSNTTISPTYLYIKQHSVTGLKYFGKTTKDPLKYNGSGKHWKRHIKEHGSEHIRTNQVFGPYIDSVLISEFALAFSRDNNIVESKDWANLINENGLDGGGFEGIKRGPQSAEHRQNLYNVRKGKPKSAESNQKRSNTQKGQIRSADHSKNISAARTGIPTGPQRKVECPHCGLSGGISAMTQHHFDRCKKRLNLVPNEITETKVNSLVNK